MLRALFSFSLFSFSLFSLTLLSLCGNVHAQSYVDVLKINGNTTALNKFDSGFSSTRVNEFSADLSLPIKLTEQSAIITGLIYENIHTKLFDTDYYYRFSSISLKMGFNRKVNDTWTYSLVLLPKLASDFKSLNKKDFQLGGIALFKYAKTENFNYKFALYANNDLFGPFIVPMFGFYYLSDDKKWESNVMAPLQADINYKASSNLTVGINYTGQIRSFHLQNTTIPVGDYYVTKASNELSTYTKIHFTKNISLQTKLGYSIGRSYRVFNGNDKVNFALPAFYANDKRTQLNTDFADGLLFQVTALYRVSL